MGALDEGRALFTEEGSLINLGFLDHYFISSESIVKTSLKDLHYECGGMLYHCMTLVERYSSLRNDLCVFDAVLKDVNNGVGIGPQAGSWHGMSDVYYEFDAIVSKGKRVLDELRLILWRRFNASKAKDPSTPVCRLDKTAEKDVAHLNCDTS